MKIQDWYTSKPLAWRIRHRLLVSYLAVREWIAKPVQW